VPPKPRYYKKDIADWARVAGLEIKVRPTVFPVNSVKAMRACILLEPDGKLVRSRARYSRPIGGTTRTSRKMKFSLRSAAG